MAITGAAGMTTAVAEVGVIIEDAAVMTGGAITADRWATKSGALSAAFFVPVINPVK